MTQIDGLSLPVRLPIDGDAFDAACEYARIHDLTISAAASEMLRSFAHSVDAGTTPPGCPEDGREGSGEPPASLPSVLSPAPTGYACIVDTCWDEGRDEGRDATWCDPDDCATAYCDDHIPDGWVKPDDTPPLTLEESKALHPSSRPVKVDTFLRPMPHIHPGAPPCVFGDRCDAGPNNGWFGSPVCTDCKLKLVESERDDLRLRLDEAEAVIDGVRTVRLDIVALVNGIGSGAGRRDRTRAAAFCRVLLLLDEVDGL